MEPNDRKLPIEGLLASDAFNSAMLRALIVALVDAGAISREAITTALHGSLEALRRGPQTAPFVEIYEEMIRNLTDDLRSSRRVN